MKSSRNRSRKGSVMLEFGIVMSVLIPLMFGTVAFGINLGNMLQSTQISRDIGHMYAQGVDFSATENKAIAVNLVQGMGGMTATGGQGVVILSSVRKIFDTDCAAAGISLAQCANVNTHVFSHRIVIGDVTLRTSNFGTPSGACTVNTDGSISSTNYMKQSGCQTVNFTDSIISQVSGDVAYVVESYFATTNLGFLAAGGGSGTSGSYTRAIF